MGQVEIQSMAELLDMAPAAERPLYAAAEAVFWETANTTCFGSAEELLQFRRKYFDYYWHAAPELFLLALTEAEGGILDPPGPGALGYVCAVADTREHPELSGLSDHIPLFADLYERYPAHLHINLTAASRGRGLGGRLIAALEERLRARGATGLHLVTDPDARNVRFYRKNGFRDEVLRSLSLGEGGTSVPLLFMGTRL